MDGKVKLAIIVSILALVLFTGKDKAKSLSGLSKRRARRLFYISHGKVIPRSEVDTAKRMTRQGYGKVYAVWAYNADEAREYIRQGKAETVNGLGEHKEKFTKNEKILIEYFQTSLKEHIRLNPKSKTNEIYNLNSAKHYGIDLPKTITRNDLIKLASKIPDALEIGKDFGMPTIMQFNKNILDIKTHTIPEQTSFIERSQMTLFGGLGEYKKGDVVEYEGGLWEVAWVDKNDSRKYLRLQKGSSHFEKNIDRVDPEKVNPTNVTLEEHYQNESDNIAINRANDRITGTLRRSKDDTTKERQQDTQDSLFAAIQDLNDRQKKKYRYYLEANSPSAKIPLAIDDPKRVKDALIELWITQPKAIMANHGTSSAGKYDFTIIPAYQKAPEKPKLIPESKGQMNLFGLGRLSKTERERIESFARYNENAEKEWVYKLNAKQKALKDMGYKEYPTQFTSRFAAKKIADDLSDSTIIDQGEWIDGTHHYNVWYRQPFAKACNAEATYPKKSQLVECSVDPKQKQTTRFKEGVEEKKGQMALFGNIKPFMYMRKLNKRWNYE